jgi:hypothetical protein
MPREDILALAVVALFVLVVGFLVAGYAAYRRIVQKLKEQNRWQNLQDSSRWAVFRFLWHADERSGDPSLSSLFRLYRVFALAYALAVVAWLLAMTLVLLP